MPETIRCERCLGAGIYIPEDLQSRMMRGDLGAAQTSVEGFNYWMGRALAAEKRADSLEDRLTMLELQVQSHSEWVAS